METVTFTPEQWARHEKFVQIFRSAKQRKREWQAKMEIVLAEKEGRVRRHVSFRHVCVLRDSPEGRLTPLTAYCTFPVFNSDSRKL